MRYIYVPYYIGDIVQLFGKDYKITNMQIRQSNCSNKRKYYYEADALDGSETGHSFYHEAIIYEQEEKMYEADI